ncbi:MAG: hypothetical protein WB626_08940 [Bacteroidota bacterium]
MPGNRLLLAFFYTAGVIATAILVVTKNEGLMLAATEGMYDGGDLYRFAKVLHFKTDLPAAQPEEEDLTVVDPDTAAVIIIGDSFLESCRGHRPFPAMLSEALGRPVRPVYAGYAMEFFDPVYFCSRHRLDPGRPRVVVLERVERYVIPTYGARRDTAEAAYEETAGESTETGWTLMRRRWFTDAGRNHEVFLTSSALTWPLVELWNTFRFMTLGQISEETPVYSLDPPFLFEREETEPGLVTSFTYPKPDSLVDAVARVIGEMGSVLRSRYNAELVFMPVPGSYTLYHRFVTPEAYDRFLPRLCRAVERKGVRTIPLYEVFRASPDPVYLPTDTHWNARGAGLALAEAVRVIRTVRRGVAPTSGKETSR